MQTYANNTFTRTVNALLFNGSPLAGDQGSFLSTLSFAWESSDPETVRIDAQNNRSATFTALKVGIAEITARVTTAGWNTQLAPGKLSIIVADAQFGIGFTPP